MSKATYEARLVAGLLALGWIEDKQGRSHYREFVKDGRRLFVGKAGALRSGRCASASHSIGDPQRQDGFYAACLAAGDKAMKPVEYE